MTCPVCEGKTTVVDCRDLGDHVVRRRKCLVCSYVFYTEECDSDTAEAEYLECHRKLNQERRLKKRAAVCDTEK